MKRTMHQREVQHPALGDQAYDLIKSDIILCKLAPGEEVTAAVLEAAPAPRAPPSSDTPAARNGCTEDRGAEGWRGRYRRMSKPSRQASSLRR